MSNLEKIRNFCIIAHIDHGKSTLADRLLEMTGTIEKRAMKEQYLDQLELERERGITIKMAPVRMVYKDHILNLIDTPGHNDFSYEVSRALTAVEGAILLVDATQGIQAQTLANFENAKKANLKIIGAINKVDLNPPQTEAVLEDLATLLNIKMEDILKISGKTGLGVDSLLNQIIEQIPSPKKQGEASRALVFDSLYDDHKGVIAFVRLFGGQFKRGDSVKFLANNNMAQIKEVGYFHPQLRNCEQLNDGEIGYIATGIKDPGLLKIGDTIIGNWSASGRMGTGNLENLAIPGFTEPQPVVFVSFYPEENDNYENLKKALAKLRLTDASLNFYPESSEILGRGFKGGFLGRLHFEITAERLEREFQIKTVHSFPSVAYKILLTGKKEYLEIKNPKDFPLDYAEVLEPITKVEILSPPKYLGNILSLREIFRFGSFETKTLGNKVLLSAKLPLADLISDLDDKLKSLSEGYASMSYEIIGYEKSKLEKLEVLIAGHLVPGLTRILPQEKIPREAKITVERLKEFLPKQQFTQAIQAAVRG
ncbi:MAG: translation elongation factor 4, partial [Patescibacteria group bacterium]